MAKIAVLLPREMMVEEVKAIIEEEQLDIGYVKLITTATAVDEARQAMDEGATIIVARGAQAYLIKKYTKVPIVEIKITAQELARLVKRGLKMVDKPYPQVALVGFANMFVDTTYFEEIFDIKRKIYYTKAMEESDEAVRKAVEDGADLIIGGDVINELAAKYQVPSLFFESTKESLQTALHTATSMAYAANMEKEYRAQFETVIDTSESGIIKIDTQMLITNLNRASLDMLGKKEELLIGKSILEVVKDLDGESIKSLLDNQRDIYTTSALLGSQAVMITCVPIRGEEETSGIILNILRITARPGKEAKQYEDVHLQGMYARHVFANFRYKSGKMKPVMERAKNFALSKKPILIQGEVGTEKERFAQAIHNNSPYKAGPYVMVNGSGLTEEEQLKIFFGDPEKKGVRERQGVLATADGGTLLITEVEKLSPVVQQRLFWVVRHGESIRNVVNIKEYYDCRLILTTSMDLQAEVEAGRFRKDLYYLVTALSLQIPPLRERPEDVENLVNGYRDQFVKNYTRYISVPEETIGVLKEYHWPGNGIQLEMFCERLFLGTPKKSVSAEYAKFLLRELYPETQEVAGERKVVVYKHPKAKEIAELLEKHHGNRSAVAKELGISTTTLWRHIKKYEVKDEF